MMLGFDLDLTTATGLFWIAVIMLVLSLWTGVLVALGVTVYAFVRDFFQSSKEAD
ncbi:hypothetical protein KKB18_00145 [bacterium]|nr:hypothetical protein [bacterium]